MADVVSPQKRSEMMSGIKGVDTKPEMLIRKALHARGLRYRLHVKKMQGKPDLVFPKYKAVMFVHGCFWHKHGCPLFKWPKTREEFWRDKLTRNASRDVANIQSLQAGGWRVVVLWECALRGKRKLPIDKVVDECVLWLLSSRQFLEITGFE